MTYPWGDRQVLRELAVSRFALIDELRISFGPGLTVLTGETGAGKSIIIQAIDLLLGARASSDVIQQGAEAATVEGLFELPPASPVWAWLRARGFPLGEHPSRGEEGHQLIVKRVVALSGSGKGRAYLNGALAPVSLLDEVGGWLADVHGQHEQQSLLRVATHLEVLDAFARLGALRDRLRERYHAWQTVEAKRASMVMDEQEKARRMDLLSFQSKEIQAARLVPGEEVRLEEERIRLANAEKLLTFAHAAYERLTGAVLPEGEGAAKALAELERIDPSCGDMSVRARQALEELRELGSELRGYRDRLEADPPTGRLDAVQDRLESIARLKKKYGATIEDTLSYEQKVRGEFEALEAQEQTVAWLDREVQKAKHAYEPVARELSTKRRAAAKRFGAAITGVMGEVGLPGAALTFVCRPRETWGVSGIDEGEMLVELNSGAGSLPLAKTASGGELSRVMLAIKSVLAGSDGVPTLVFDEVDSGIGGRVAEAVGAKLKALARHREGTDQAQVLCVTHLAQIAGFADHHVVIEKRTAKGRTTTGAALLAGESAVVEELAKMLSGDPPTVIAKEHAAELLLKGHRVKGKR